MNRLLSIKKYSILFNAFTLLFCISSKPFTPQRIFIDFDLSMQKDLYPKALINAEKYFGIEGNDLYNIFKKNYESKNLMVVKLSKQPRIPKIIHQIWIGKEVPKEFLEFQKSWKEHHPDWEYHLWTQHNIPFKEFRNYDLIKESGNLGEVSDLVRLELLYKFGGLYVDMDTECFRAHDILHHAYDFYMCLQPLDSDIIQLANSPIGSKPGHPILEKMIKEVRRRSFMPEYKNNIPFKTGPVALTRAFLRKAHKDGFVDMALPPYFMFPLKSKETEIEKEKWIESGAFSVHYWAKTWMHPKCRPQQFKTVRYN